MYLRARSAAMWRAYTRFTFDRDNILAQWIKLKIAALVKSTYNIHIGFIYFIGAVLKISIFILDLNLNFPVGIL